ncbi:hypothetical protein F4810DRAFT_706624 [Camillea tinctor]|nr:hypothetical protein F4810DRAFT_706624 [Camillea tinctor]
MEDADVPSEPVPLIRNLNRMSRDWWFSNYALCTIRTYSDTGRFLDHALYINSQSLWDFLQATIGGLQTDGAGGMELVVKAPFFPLFYSLERLTAHSKRFAPFVYSSSETELLLSWVREHFKHEIELTQNHAANWETAAVPFESLWIAFPPGTIICPHPVHVAQATRVVECWYIGGARPLLVLKTEPIDAMKNPVAMRNYLRECGRKFENYAGTQLKQYNGIAIAYEERVRVSGHIMLDAKSYFRSCNTTPTPMRKITRVTRSAAAKPELITNLTYRLSEEHAMVTALTMRGICLHDDLPAQFVVSNIADVQWEEGCLDSPVMDNATKKELQAHMPTPNNGLPARARAQQGVHLHPPQAPGRRQDHHRHHPAPRRRCLPVGSALEWRSVLVIEGAEPLDRAQQSQTQQNRDNTVVVFLTTPRTPRPRSASAQALGTVGGLEALAHEYPFNGWQIGVTVQRAGAEPGLAELEEGARAVANPGVMMIRG